ncbi:hypothetical protein ACODRN_05050 [Leuconostoc mesenteroides]|uniref:hypothetical protein n=1 Tax=Leuconostoc mesenteroides TaxID=1245 RepID=UPI003B502C6E
MTLTMYQADRNYVTPANDASLYSSLVDDTNGTLNRGNKLGITVNGLIATVNTGQAVIQGRLVEVVKPENVTLPPNSSGKICLTVDLSKTNDVIGQAGTPEYSVKVNQVYLAVVTGDMLQDDLNNGGIVYQLPIGSFNSSTTTATVSVIKNVFNDTGWKDLDIASTGAKLITYDSNSPFAQYRCINNIMHIRWQGVDCSNANNTNQIGRVPWSLRPDVEFSTAAIDFGVRDDGGSGNTIYPVLAHVNETTTLWVTYPGNHMGNLCGTLSYPISHH